MTDRIRVSATRGNWKVTYYFEITKTIEEVLQIIRKRFQSLWCSGSVIISFECPPIVDNVDKNPSNKSWKIHKKLLLTAGGVIVGAAATPILLPAVLGAAGFTCAGVTAGSVAASIQSVVYGGYVASGSAFAVCQSIGTAGVGATSVAAGGVAGGAMGGAVAGLLGLRRLEKTVQVAPEKVVLDVSMSDTLEYIISKMRRSGVQAAARVSLKFNI